ncbi:hypothetical protein NCAS_0C00860 [Naumovozyma castellii]|uniref:Uncharacterized protein n=1 Tax=Naumovozyma castellii TaxID=27288 RepID=G0VC67_NAUCA|nr:hypothetical protein NCAS_0C00860 [Naumovozyma castellii CBS 4309]CCC69076.1 hypothetical protein NCAS_0C00860 [Naumovozyma castellii CBS 4309]
MSLDRYVSMIDAILSASNPDEVSPKKIRRALQELFNVDLDAQRKAVNDLIIERFNALQDRPKVKESSNTQTVERSPTLSEEGQVDEDRKFALQLQKEADESRLRKKSRSTTSKKKSSPKVTEDGKEKKKKRKRKDAEGSNSISAKKYVLSEPLQQLIGEKELPRTQVVKMVWSYIKEHNLQNPSDRREIISDELMEPVFGKKMTIFSMHKILSKHLFNKDELVDPTN